MTIKNSFLLICSALMLMSCSRTFYQVYSVKSDDVKMSDNSLVYENEDCKISYNLWSEYGNPGFVIYNKTDRDLFIILPQSFYIENGVAFDYYENKITEKSVDVSKNESASLGFLVPFTAQNEIYRANDYNYKRGNRVNFGSKVSFVESPILCIPTKSSKSFSKYKLKNHYEESCESKLNHPKRKVILSQFNEESTPLKFRNRISYAFDKEGNNLKSIDNSFWLSDIINYSKKGATTVQKTKNCKTSFEEKVYVFTISAPDKFFITYK